MTTIHQLKEKLIEAGLLREGPGEYVPVSLPPQSGHIVRLDDAALKAIARELREHAEREERRSRR